MSSNQEFVIKIPNDIIGKAWLASLDNSGGYMLSLKPIEQSSSSSISPEKEQEDKPAVPETNSPIFEVPEKSKKEARWNENSPILGELRSHFISYFKKESQKLRVFVEEVNLYDLDILPIEYEKLGISKVKNDRKSTDNSISGKIEDLIQKFDNINQLSCLKKVFIQFINSST